MDIKIGINNGHCLKNCHNNSGKDILTNIYVKKNKKRELLINSFIKKFPKVKLHTIIEVNKYYTDHYEIDNDKKKISNENEIINDYLMS
jgi:hypothetical protein